MESPVWKLWGANKEDGNLVVGEPKTATCFPPRGMAPGSLGLVGFAQAAARRFEATRGGGSEVRAL